ncbi:type II toxin-antitoxin system ParD family antitoxin [Roseateles sp.]|uniref:type II toxin-antitoxin system ParD family antitoxin n=1 Tax=Roseateles sp. TaxID=1971397 RepID=UPI002F3EC0D2
MLNLIESGKYSSRTQVLRDSVELQAWREARLKAFEDSFAEGVAEEAISEGESVEDVFLPLIAKYQALADSKK